MQSQLTGQLCFAHAVHQAQTNGFGGFAFDGSHVGHHLVKVGVGVIAVCVHHPVRTRQVQEACIVHQEARFLGTEVICCPQFALLRQEERTHHGADDFVAGRNLLQVGVVHRQPPSDGAAVIVAHLVHVRMNPASLFAEVHVRLQKRAVCFVGFTGFDNQLSHRMFTVVQEVLGKAWCPGSGLAISHTQLIKGQSNRLSCPDIHRFSTG